MAQPMFDRKIEALAQKYIRARIVAEQAEEALEEAKEQLMAFIPQGSHYVTKDGESIAHVKATVRMTFVAEALAKLLPARIWRAVQVPAVDSEKLRAFIKTGEVDIAKIKEGIQETPVRSSLRVTWPSIKPTTSPQPTLPRKRVA